MYDEQGKLLGEYDASGTPIQETLYLNDLPVAILKPNGPNTDIFYIYADQLNTPRVITDTTNQLRWRWDSDPFGTFPVEENPSGLGAFTCNLRLPGQYFDKETNTHYNYFRDYDPAIGRYIQSDPIGLAGGANTYAYVRGAPLNNSDPLGLISPLGIVLGSACVVGTGALYIEDIKTLADVIKKRNEAEQRIKELEKNCPRDEAERIKQQQEIERIRREGSGAATKLASQGLKNTIPLGVLLGVCVAVFFGL